MAGDRGRRAALIAVAAAALTAVAAADPPAPPRAPAVPPAAARAAGDFLGWLATATEHLDPRAPGPLAREAAERFAAPFRRGRAVLDEAPAAESEAERRFAVGFGRAANALVRLAEAAKRPFPERVEIVFAALGEAALAEEALYPLRREVAELRDLWPRRPAAAPGASGAALTGIAHVGAGGRHGGFSLYVPEDYEPSRAWPVVVALHGAGGDGRRFLWTWMRAAVRHGCVLVAPSSPGRTWAIEDGEGLLEILAWLDARWRIDRGRVLLTGFSDGATLALVFGLLNPDAYRAIAPVAGVLDPRHAPLGNLDRARGVPVRIVHGARDFVFPVARGRELRDVLRAAGADVEHRELPALSHLQPPSETEAILAWFDGLPRRAAPAGGGALDRDRDTGRR